MKDFTVKKYEAFLRSALKAGYHLTSFEDFLKNDFEKVLILRHDVDKLPLNSLSVAELQHDLGVKGTYYFRAVPKSFDEQVIQKIVDLGHEVGYHYEDLSLCGGNHEKALEHFKVWLDKLRKFYPVSTICMHGSPMSKWDNRALWEKYDYKEFGIVGEPYFDVNFDEVFYITDTGRRWDGNKVSVRDKVSSKFDLSFRSTDDLINAFERNELPDKIMQNIHPQRWTDNKALWIKEKYVQSGKNVIKKYFYVKK